MATISEKVKAALSAMEAAVKALSVVDEDYASAEQVRGLLDVRRAELADVEARLARANEEFAKADAEHNDWRQKAAKEQSATNSRIDQAQERLRALEQQVADGQAKFDNIIAGISALHARLRV
jgi:chromosome segregation ATPase